MSRKRKTPKVTLAGTPSKSTGAPLDFRYGKGWEQLSRDFRLACPKCCYCLKKDAKLTHHVQYVDEYGRLLLDDVILGVHVYTMCDGCHRIVHSFANYVISSEGKQFNHNRQVVKDKLKLGYRLITGN